MIDFCFSFLPTKPMNQPNTGTKMMAKSVSCHDVTTSVTKYASISMGFLNSMSRLDIMEFSISCTSPVMRAMMSPLRSSLKNPSGSEFIFSYSRLRMSRTTPVLIGTMVADERK